jgi:hypothetical protein
MRWDTAACGHLKDMECEEKHVDIIRKWNVRRRSMGRSEGNEM